MFSPSLPKSCSLACVLKLRWHQASQWWLFLLWFRWESRLYDMFHFRISLIWVVLSAWVLRKRRCRINCPSARVADWFRGFFFEPAGVFSSLRLCAKAYADATFRIFVSFYLFSDALHVGLEFIVFCLWSLRFFLSCCKVKKCVDCNDVCSLFVH